MSICDNCIHNAVCGLEDCHDEAMTFCSDMISKDKYKAKSEPQMKNGLTTYQIYLILLGYLADHVDGEMLKPMLTELYKKAEWEQTYQYNKPMPDEIVARRNEECER